MNNENTESMRLVLIALLRKCADDLSKLPLGDVQGIQADDLELRMTVVKKKKKAKTSRPSADLFPLQVEDVVKRLSLLDSREEGERILHEVAPNRTALEKIAKHLDVAVRREDRHNELMSRIIESTIGFRLGAAAIQGRSASKVSGNTENYHPIATKK